MLYEIVIIIVITIIIGISTLIGGLEKNFLGGNFIEDKNKTFVLTEKNTFKNNGILNKLNSGKLIIGNQEYDVSNDINYVENKNKVNFLSFDIEKMKGEFEIDFEYGKNWRLSILGLVCKNNDKSSDLELPNLNNKISIGQNNNEIILNDSKNFYDNLNCYYIQVSPEEITSKNLSKNKDLGRKIIFKSNGEIENYSILLYFQKVKINDPSDDLIEGNKENGNDYYGGVRYVFRKISDSDELKLRNFYIVRGNKKYGIGNEKLSSITFQIPIIFYTR